MNNTYQNFYSIIAFFPPFFSLPGCTVVDNAKVNEGFIGDGETFICCFAHLIVVPKQHSSNGWTKVTEKLDIDICVTGVMFHAK
jgi:hypothetical protein